MSNFVGKLDARTPEFGLEGSDLLGFGHFDGALDHLPDDLIELGPKLPHDRFDASLS